MREHLRGWDHALFRQVATRHWPLAEPVLPRLGRAANHGALWLVVAGGLAVTAGSSGRRAALRGVGSLALGSAAVNIVGKRAVRRTRPALEAVPVIRRPRRRPATTSFPSGHAASAAAFTAGVALESPRLAAAVAPVAWLVAFSRVYTGVHYPGDVVAGALLGVGAALAGRGLVPTGERPPGPGVPPPVPPPVPAGPAAVPDP